MNYNNMTANDFIKFWVGKNRGEDQRTLIDTSDFFYFQNKKVDAGTVVNKLDGQKVERIRSIKIDDSQLPNLQFSKIEIEFIQIVNDSDLNDIFILDQSNVVDLLISNSKIKILKIRSSSIKNIRISDNSVIKQILIQNSIIDSIKIEEGSCIKKSETSYENDGVDFHVQSSTISILNINELAEQSQIIVENSNIKELKVTSSDIFLDLVSNKISQFTIEKNCLINKLKISDQSIENGLISSCKINEITFENLLYKDSTLRISNIEFGGINFKNFINYGNLRFNNIKSYNYEKFINQNLKLSIINSDLGKAQFIECTFDKKYRFEFANSKISEIFIVGPSLPSQIDIPKDYLYLDLYEQQRLLTGQLRKVYEATGDVVKISHYQANGLNLLRQQIKLQQKKSLRERFDYLSLSMNFLSSRFGDSSARALVITLSISIFLYLIYCFTLGYHLSTHPNSQEWSCFGELAAYYFEFINPTHKIGFMQNIGGHIPINTGWSLFWDGFSRILITYLIYQFIQAFRKYGKRD